MIRNRTPHADETADGKAPESKGKPPDADGATPVPHDGASVDGSEPANPPRCADAGGGRAAPSGSDMLSIGALSSAAQGASYYERDGYYAKDDPEHRDASAWAGKGAEELGLKGPVDRRHLPRGA